MGENLSNKSNKSIYGEWVNIVRYGEIAVKGKETRNRMEKRLKRNIIDALNKNNVKYRSVSRIYGRIIVNSFDNEEECNRSAYVLSKVMGVVSVSPAVKTKFTGLDDLVNKAVKFFIKRINGDTFAVEVNRVGQHSFTSIDVKKIVGKKLVELSKLKVDLENPEYTAYIEIRGSTVYFYDKIVKGPGGLPIGSEGKVISLFSGGIDSPVASWLMMKRGCEVDFLLFDIGGREQVENVLLVAKALINRWGYGYRPKLYVINLRRLIPKIALYVPEHYIVIILRRLMMRIASMLARKVNAKALVTGESLGQVASQTLDNLYTIDEAADIPVLRPLIGFDKNEIAELARIIGTYSYSIRVKEYCLVGTKKVITRASLEKVREIEKRMQITTDDLMNLIDSMEEYDLWNIDIEDQLESRRLSRRLKCKA